MYSKSRYIRHFQLCNIRVKRKQCVTVVSCCGIFTNPSRLYSKQQTRGEEKEKCLDEVLEPTYYFSIFSIGGIGGNGGSGISIGCNGIDGSGGGCSNSNRDGMSNIYEKATATLTLLKKLKR